MPLAAKAGMLAALVVPPENGETEFADMRAAWDELDDDTQKKLEDSLLIIRCITRNQGTGSITRPTTVTGFTLKVLRYDPSSRRTPRPDANPSTLGVTPTEFQE
jgi:alpha-ketoglutarate-dependent taurine dioxygenase